MSSVIDDKGRITIPKRLREQFGLETGEIIDFITINDKLLIAKKITVKLFLERTEKIAENFDEQSSKEIDVEKLF